MNADIRETNYIWLKQVWLYWYYWHWHVCVTDDFGQLVPINCSRTVHSLSVTL